MKPSEARPCACVNYNKLCTPNPRFLRTLGPPNIGSAKIEGAKIKVIVM